MEETFLSFCGGKPDLDGTGFAKLLTDTRLLDKNFTARDADIIFAKSIPQGKRRMEFATFKKALELVAARKGLPLQEVHDALELALGPIVSGTLPSKVRLYDESGVSSQSVATVLPPISAEGRQGSKRLGSKGIVRLSTGVFEQPGTLSRRPSKEISRASSKESAALVARTTTPASQSYSGSFTSASSKEAGAGARSSVTSTAPAGVKPRQMTYSEVFQAYCGKAIDLDGKSFTKLCKDSGFMKIGLTAAEADLLFLKACSKGQRRLTLPQFESALRLIGEKLGRDWLDLTDMVEQTGGPATVAPQGQGEPVAPREKVDKIVSSGLRAEFFKSKADSSALDESVLEARNLFEARKAALKAYSSEGGQRP